MQYYEYPAVRARIRRDTPALARLAALGNLTESLAARYASIEISYDSLPICIRRMLDSPNDLLLRPACVRQLTRVLLALGWHPRHVAGLICMKFEEDHEWGNTWDYFDRLTRAEFYVRVFSGQCIGYCDPLKDFNCVSAQEQGLCVPGDAGSISLTTTNL
jgi:hypothetical protein